MYVPMLQCSRDVRDHFDITTLHNINTDGEGILHLVLEMINAVIININNATNGALNVAHGNILHMG